LYCAVTDIFNDIGRVVRVAESKSDIENFMTVINLITSDCNTMVLNINNVFFTSFDGFYWLWIETSKLEYHIP
jgi:hypothetical protein